MKARAAEGSIVAPAGGVCAVLRAGLLAVLVFGAGAGAIARAAERPAGELPAGEPPRVDGRLADPRDADTLVVPPTFATKQQWTARAEHLRQQILASSGLWPMPARTPLGTKIFDRIEHDGYSVEKVYFESHPGFLVTGNLYRPLGKKPGPYPAVLGPHGHWHYGRLENTETSSVPARAISLARHGYVVFNYDMIGYGDSQQLPHTFGGRREALWGVSLAGLQLWNGIRALDFVASLPDVDAGRIGVTGASGGGTQTFMLAAVDARVAVSAPVNMVSARMQGGCLCENPPGLRLGTSNVEFAAMAAPRPLLLVSTSGDWTRDVPFVEFPWVQGIYRLFGAEDRVRVAAGVGPHNYNQWSREAVYQWMGRWLLGIGREGAFKEGQFKADPPWATLVFYGRERPKHAVTAEALVAHLESEARAALAGYQLKGTSARTELTRLRAGHGLALRLSIGATMPAPGAVAAFPAGQGAVRKTGASSPEQIVLTRPAAGDRVPAAWWRAGNSARRTTVVVHESGRAALAGSDGRPGALVAALLGRGQAVLAIDAYQTGEARGEGKKVEKHKDTYNLTDDGNRVQDILTAVAHARASGARTVNLIGVGRAGLWVMLARALAPDAIAGAAVDAAGFDRQGDAAYLEVLYVPGIRRAGDLATAAALAAPARLLVHDTGTRFTLPDLPDLYRALGAPRNFEAHAGKVDDARLAAWLAR